MHSCSTEGPSYGCAPDRLERVAFLPKKNLLAEIHLCGESLGFYYFLKIREYRSSMEGEPLQFPENPDPPEIRWDGDTLVIKLPKGMHIQNPGVWAGIKLSLEGSE